MLSLEDVLWLLARIESVRLLLDAFDLYADELTSDPFCRCGRGLTNRWSGRVRDKVPSPYVGARAAQLNL